MKDTRNKSNKKPDISIESKIWEYYYKCRIHAFLSRSVEDIRENGITVTGIPDLDEAMKNDWISRYLTINQMVEYFRKGVPFKVVDINDTKDIYETIQIHLTNWVEHLRTGLNVRNAPLEDLLDMDKLAGVVYQHAKYIFTPDIMDSLFGKHMMEVQRINMTNFFSNPSKESRVTTINPIKENEDNKIPERTSFEDKFKQSIVTFRRFE